MRRTRSNDGTAVDTKVLLQKAPGKAVGTEEKSQWPPTYEQRDPHLGTFHLQERMLFDHGLFSQLLYTEADLASLHQVWVPTSTSCREKITLENCGS